MTRETEWSPSKLHTLICFSSTLDCDPDVSICLPSLPWLLWYDGQKPGILRWNKPLCLLSCFWSGIFDHSNRNETEKCPWKWMRLELTPLCLLCFLIKRWAKLCVVRISYHTAKAKWPRNHTLEPLKLWTYIIIFFLWIDNRECLWWWLKLD